MKKLRKNSFCALKRPRFTWASVPQNTRIIPNESRTTVRRRELKNEMRASRPRSSGVFRVPCSVFRGGCELELEDKRWSLGVPPDAEGAAITAAEDSARPGVFISDTWRLARKPGTHPCSIPRPGQDP